MCGPVNDEKGKAKHEEFLDEFSDALATTLEGSSIFSSERILDDGKIVLVPDRPWPKRDGKRKRVIH